MKSPSLNIYKTGGIEAKFNGVPVGFRFSNTRGSDLSIHKRGPDGKYAYFAKGCPQREIDALSVPERRERLRALVMKVLEEVGVEPEQMSYESIPKRPNTRATRQQLIVTEAP